MYKMIQAITPKNKYIAFINNDNQLFMFLPNIKLEYKLEKVKIESEPVYVVNKPIPQLLEIIDIMTTPDFEIKNNLNFFKK